MTQEYRFLDLKQSGLNIKLLDKNLKLSEDLSYSEIVERKAEDLNKVLYQASHTPRSTIYKVWKGIAQNKDKEKIKIQKLSYDITVIFPIRMGRELPRTFGHYHSLNESGVAYPEIYEVIFGQAWFLIQKAKKTNPKVIEEIYMIEAMAGDKVIIPPEFGHIASNPCEEELILANWRSSDLSYDYEAFSNLRGAGYYFLEYYFLGYNKSNEIEFEKNSYYDKIPEIVKLYPKPVLNINTRSEKPMYEMINNPENLDFLNNPQKYLKILTIDSCFKRA